MTRYKTNKAIVLVVFLITFLSVLFVLQIHPFLSRENPVKGEILVFEGWIYNKDNAIKEAIAEYNHGQYFMLVTVGSRIESSVGHNGQANLADKAKQAFIESGFDPKLIHAIVVPNVRRHRTYSMALAFRIWLEQSDLSVKKMNVFTFGVHARKSEIVFKQALEPDVEVGVLSATPCHYEPDFWWLDWVGIKWVFFNFLGYLTAFV